MIYLRIYDRNGTTLLGLLPEPISYSMSFEFSEVGALTFEYPTTGLNADKIAELREVAVVDSYGDEYVNARFVITGIDRDRISSTGSISVSARSILWRADTALAYPDGGVASGEVSRFFDTQTAGSIIKTLVDDALARGAMAGMTYDFTATTDSNSAAWGLSTTQEYPARTTILSVIRGLADLGLVEVKTNGRQLSATKADGIGTDKTTGSSPIVLRYGYNITEAPESVDGSTIAGAVLVEGEGGLLVERSNSTTVGTYGRLETALTASGIDDTATVNALGDVYLGTLSDADRQLTVGLTLQPGTPQPLADFIPGDYVYTQTNAGLERVRVRQIAISMSGGTITASATLGDRLYENDIRVARRLSAITSGSVQAGNGTLLTPQATATLVNDGIAPSAPTSLTGTTAGYVEGIEPRASVSLNWTAPTTNANGTPLTDLAYYNVQKRNGSSDPWEFAAISYNPVSAIKNLSVDTSYRFRVFAVDTVGNRSTASTEFVITTANLVATETTPSTPVLTSRLGTISITWNGLGAAGAAMSPTFSYLAVHVSTTSGFTPGAGTYEARMNGADTIVLSDLAYSTTYYVKFVAYNKAGTPSTASAQASASIQPLVDADIIANTISGAKIASGTITASDKIIANTITGGLIQALAISSDKIAANAITAGKIEAGAVTAAKIDATAIDGKTITGATVRTSSGTARVEMNTSGLFVYNSSGTAVVSLNASGTASFTGTISSTSGDIGGFSISPTFLSAGVNFRINSDTGQATFGSITNNGTMSLGGTVSAGGNNFNNVGTLSASSVSIVNSISIAGGYGITSDWSPNSDASYTLGQSARRWTRLWATTTTISTSDRRLKKDITTSPLGLDFIKSLRPVSYRWKVGDSQVVLDDQGEPVVIGETPEGKPIFQMQDRPGVRLHYGFLAQEVKEVLDASGVEDFAGWVQDDLTDPDSRQSLSYEQFIAPLTKAVQELATRVEQLEDRA